jgi:mannose-6-phosphate isomerase-like protein (cupin superfamily)
MSKIITIQNNINNTQCNLVPTKIVPLKKEKGWGYEIWMVNNNKYCGKLLHFDGSAKFSMHYHLQKDETWYVLKGTFIFRWIDTSRADIIEEILTVGESIHIPPGLPHQLETVDGGEIIETSTEHFEEDSYRVMKGDSQK